jgi:hypothetical protein
MTETQRARNGIWPGDTVVRMKGRGRSFGTRQWQVTDVDERYGVLHLEFVTNHRRKLTCIISPIFCQKVEP